jgi:site-specific DNA-methyltransferase (adenine-specific)
VAGNVLAYGTGALNIDGCRVGSDGGTTRGEGGGRLSAQGAFTTGHEVDPINAGRWPANLVFTHAADCEQVGATDDTFGGGANATSGFVDGYESGDGFTGKTVKVPVWACADGCPVAELDGQSGTGKDGVAVQRNGGRQSIWGATNNAGSRPDAGYGGQGGASRFFTVTEWDLTADVPPFRYVAKPSKRERNAGLEGLPEKERGLPYQGMQNMDGGRDRLRQNHHPTVKPVALMRWLVRLVTPPGGTVLDPFAGSGTTLVAAVLEGFDAIGIEMTDDYLPIINGRVAWAEEQADKMTPTLFDDAGQGVRVTSLSGASIDPTGDATPGQGQV